ncbi:indole-3-glycerol phosphate synthase, chloroplastic-like [Coffea arabica]|uniref:indole-3-glycerol-phosphate synthase n=1 Tax=Coffea arabica TaxID=13443 RepID=A0ABM4W3C2_COFAR
MDVKDAGGEGLCLSGAQKLEVPVQWYAVVIVEIAKAYEKGGAACLSGGFENLEKIRNSGVKCPLLCKEFVIDAWQIYYARTKGADAILLIAAVLPDLDIKYMTKICKLLGLTPLVEVHDEREMDRVLGIDGIELIGINNRNLETFKVDISNTKNLLQGERGRIIRERGIIVVGESGLFTPADIAYVQEAGVKAINAIHTSFWKISMVMVEEC